MLSEMEDRGEIKIPVFSVLKNGVILKNIFLNNPRWESKPFSSDLAIEEHEEDEDDPVLIGRHPDCHIVLDHPSISRFHLEIRARPASQQLAVVDRSSVHGTWVSGKRIQPNVAVGLREGDMVKLGASTRVYKLHWVPVSCAFEMEMPLPAVLEENEETHQLENLNEVWAEEIPSAPPLPESLSLPVEKGNQSPLKELGERSLSFCPADPMSESVTLPTEGKNRTPEKNGNANEVQSERECMSPLTSGKKVKSLSILSRRSKSKSVSSLHIQTGRNRQRSCTKGLEVGIQEYNVTLGVYNREETICRVLFDNKKENEKEEIFVSAKENMTPLSSMGQKSRVRMQDKEARTPQAPSSQKQNRPISANCLEEEGDEVHASGKENLTLVVSPRHRLRERLEELQISSLNNEEVIYADKENWTPEVPKEKKSKKLIHKDCLKINGEVENEAFPSDKENLTPDVAGSRKSKKPRPWDFWQVDGEEEYSDKENITPNVSGVNKLKKKLTDSQARAEREITERRKERIPFQPLWENSPKNGSPLNHSQRIVDKERSPFRSLYDKSPLKNCSSPLNDAQRAEIKENVPFQSLLENSPSKPSSSLSYPRRTVDEEGAPFQSLHNSPLTNSSPVSNAQKRVDTGNKYPSFIHTHRTEDELSNSSSQFVEQVLHKAGGNKKKWNMVVDTDCFLNEESRKALQLLEGLKGTQLIIPRIVIRELDCLRRRESLFRKNTKAAASSVLQWIEECMVRSSWWIHVQSSLETMPVAPTPPATPHELADGSDDLNAGGSNFTTFSTCGSLLEIVSPNAEDHVLDCALLFKRIKDDGQLVLLTGSITLKIKAMAEGLLCEAASEFRESLVNPYSKRFLWSDSSPRGSTWSCLDEVGMIENYYQQFPAVRNTARPSESIRGLRLILLHNSHYRMTSSIN